MNVLENIDLLEFIGRQESQSIIPLSDFKDSILERLANGIKHFGDEIPWEKHHDNFRLRPHEVTLWAGINGHGKSLVLSHVMAHLMKSTKCILASLEMKADAVGERLVKQIAGLEKPTDSFSRGILDWTDDKLWIYDELDTVEHKRIIGMCIYAFTELNIQHVFIDSLMKCGMDEDDYNSQKRFVDRLCWVAKTHGGHIHLVAHMRKGKTEFDVPDKFDVMGSSAITNLVDNVVIVHRNKKKEMEMEKGNDVDKMIPDSIVKVVKQRHGDWEGKINLWLDKPSQQFKGSPDGRLEWFDVKFEAVTNIGAR